MSDSGIVASGSASATASEDSLQSPSQGYLFKALLVAVHSALSLLYSVTCREHFSFSHCGVHLPGSKEAETTLAEIATKEKMEGG